MISECSAPVQRPQSPSHRSFASKPEPAALDAPPTTLQPIRLQRVATPAERTRWRTLIARHHYLGYRVPFGAHLRYLIQTTSPSPVVRAACSSPRPPGACTSAISGSAGTTPPAPGASSRSSAIPAS
ncbi:MAG: Druantia anti-phage system protein DruA [Acidiferrobacteraceae bacterium]